MVVRKVGKYEVGRTIGEGTFAQNTETGESVAMKVHDRSTILKHKMVDQIKRELSIMKLVGDHAFKASSMKFGWDFCIKILFVNNFLNSWTMKHGCLPVTYRFTAALHGTSNICLRLPFWPYAKGIAILVLVVPYFRGAAYVYLHFIRPYIYENSQIHGFLLIPKAEVSMLNEENCLPDAAESYNRGKREDELEKFVIYEVESKSSHDNIETDLKNSQKHWSCAVCLISASSEKCLEKHLQGKKHRAMEEEQRRNEAVESKRVSFPCKMKTKDRMAPLNNLNPNTWVNLANLSSLLNPIARSISWCTWKSPEFGWTKLNTDGSVHSENARFGGFSAVTKVIGYALTYPNLL